MMAFAPASIVARIDSGVLPPEAMMGIVGKSARIFATILGVSLPPATFRMEAPCLMRAPTCVLLLLTIVTTTGISTS